MKITVDHSNRKINYNNSKIAKENGVQGAQWVSVCDECTCLLCRKLDGKTIRISHPDYEKFVPPIHDGCRCTRVYILKEEENVEFNWRTPNKKLVEQFYKPIRRKSKFDFLKRLFHL